jgi:NADPH:quinone reductase-like Zn-dependent oxidoreductase
VILLSRSNRLSVAHARRGPAVGEGLRAIGADQIVVGLHQVSEPVFGVLENVGGSLLAQALSLVDRGGSLQSIGMASREASTIDFERERRRAGERRVEIFVVGAGLGADITYLASLLATRPRCEQSGPCIANSLVTAGSAPP